LFGTMTLTALISGLPLSIAATDSYDFAIPYFSAALGSSAWRRIGHRHDFCACLAETRRVILQHAACSDDSDFDGHKGD
jgi:hypothetical protein